MEQFEYKIALWTHKVCIAKEMIEYRGTTVPGPAIKNIGIGFISITTMAVNGAISGVVGNLLGNKIARGGFGNSGEITKTTDLKDLPNSMGQLIIGYKLNEQEKEKFMRIPINSDNPDCKRMLEKVMGIFKDKFIGFGPQAVMEKAMGVSQKAAYIFVGIIVLVIVAYGIYSALNQGGY